MKTGKRVLYIACCLLFLVCLISANYIVSALLPTAKDCTGEVQTFMKKEVYSAVDYYHVLDDMEETVQFYGWAFVGTDSDNSGKKIGIVLVGKDRQYLFETDDLRVKEEVCTAYADSLYRLKGKNHAFSMSFSTLNVKCGTYQVAIYDYENSEDYGLYYTQYTFSKKPGSMSIESFSASEVPPLQVDTCIKDAVTVVSKNSLDDGAATIWGWGFIPEFDCTKQAIYLQLSFSDGTVKYFNTLPSIRSDVAEAYENKKYMASGFHAVIPAEGIEGKTYAVTVLIDDGSTIHVCDDTPWQNEEVVLKNRPEEEETVMAWIDSMTIQDDGMFCAWGWAYQPGLDCGSQSVYFDINGTTYTTLSTSRPDVANAYESELYTMSGYNARIPVENVPEGEFTVQLFVENSGELYSAPPIAMVRSGDTIEKKS